MWVVGARMRRNGRRLRKSTSGKPATRMRDVQVGSPSPPGCRVVLSKGIAEKFLRCVGFYNRQLGAGRLAAFGHERAHCLRSALERTVVPVLLLSGS